MTAADLVSRGFTGPPTVLEGRFGFYQAFLSGQADLAEITKNLGTDWCTPDIFFKPYPANHFTHAGIDAARRMRRAGLRPDDVDHAVLKVAPAPLRTIGEPLAAKQAPETGYQAQFSGPYTVAAALFGGGGLGLGLGDFTDELAQDPAADHAQGRPHGQPVTGPADLTRPAVRPLRSQGVEDGLCHPGSTASPPLPVADHHVAGGKITQPCRFHRQFTRPQGGGAQQRRGLYGLGSGGRGKFPLQTP